ncbi:MAG: hypothetical protein E6I96_09045 [Chloroflexi bacterium]|nr:MAG: hypothetical protein E6I96_09045 [Chloroflexota bacterium]
MIQAPGVELAPLETERFGVVVARSPRLTRASLDEALRFCRDHRVSMLIARVPATDLRTVQALEGEGFRLMDTLVRYEIALKTAPAPPISSAIRPLKPGEDEAVVSVARAAFAGYFGHYHADPRLDRRACDEVYVSWARRACASADPSDVVLVAEVAGGVAAFAAIRDRDGAGELSLGAVAPQSRGRSLYKELTLAGIAWAGARGAQRFTADTQIQNYAAHRAWAGAGMTVASAAYTFHKWFDEGAG